MYLYGTLFLSFLKHTFIFSTAQPRQDDFRLTSVAPQNQTLEIYDTNWKQVCFTSILEATIVCRSFGYTGKHFFYDKNEIVK